MTFDRQADAKRFVVSKVLEQGEGEGVSLSKAERHMLSWSESGPDFILDDELAEALARESSDEQFEHKVSGLIRRAFERDVGADRTAELGGRFNTRRPTIG